MDLRDLARSQRRRQAVDALEFERERETALREQLADTASELEGPAVDDEAFSRIAPEEADIVRKVLLDDDDGFEASFGEDGFGGEVGEDWLADADDGSSPELERAERLSEVERLEAEIGQSLVRQQALQRYLEALGGAQ